MGNKKLLILVALLLCVGMCRCWIEDVAEETHSLADWARHALSDNEEFGSESDIEQEANENIKYKAEYAASRATEKIKSAASGASEYASQKAADTKEAISGAMESGREKASEAYNGGGGGGGGDVIRMPMDKMAEAKDTMQDTYEDAKQKLQTASDKASEKFNDAKDIASNVYDEARNKMSDMTSSGNERIKMGSQRMYNVKNKVKDPAAMDCGQGYMANNIAEDDFDRAKNEVGDAYQRAMNSMSEAAKTKYEAAKEKASEATGNLGAKMRSSP